MSPEPAPAREPARAPARPPTSSVPKYTALYDYTAADEDEVSFEEGAFHAVVW